MIQVALIIIIVHSLFVRKNTFEVFFFKYFNVKNITDYGEDNQTR